MRAVSRTGRAAWAVAIAVGLGACGGPESPPPAAPARPPAARHDGRRGGAGHHPAARHPTPLQVVHGMATWYGGGLDGGPTASGERFDKRKLTAAHRSLPFGTIVRVTRDSNHRSVTVRINDRGPFGHDRRRIIDLSEAAARKLDMIGAGVARVTIEVLSRPAHR
jgi:rare lipoprotein A (peptidoglycan hydrolase)